MEQTQNTTPVNQAQMIPVITRKGKRWTPEEDAQLLEQVNNGISLDDIATTHQRSVAAITMRILMHATKAIQNGMSVEDAAIHYKLPADRIAQGLIKSPKSPKVNDTELPILIPNVNAPAKHINKGKRWTPEEDAQLLQRLISGSSVDDIALAHERKIPAVKRRIFSLSIAAHTNGMPLEDVSRIYRVPSDKITTRIAKQTIKRPVQQQVVPNNTAQLDVIIEIRDLLRLLVSHMTKDPIPNTK